MLFLYVAWVSSKITLSYTIIALYEDDKCQCEAIIEHGRKSHIYTYITLSHVEWGKRRDLARKERYGLLSANHVTTIEWLLLWP